jgi:biopolymer transport protein ExbD
MNFQRGRMRDEPEINLIPMIDIFLVIIIFLMVSTTYTKFSELQINLPQASGDETTSQAKQINVSVDASEHYAINSAATTFNSVQNMSQMLRTAAGEQKDPTIVINADAKAPHQAVINIMEAARLAGYGRITFTTSRK